MNLFNCDLETIPVPFVKIPIVITLMFFQNVCSIWKSIWGETQP